MRNSILVLPFLALTMACSEEPPVNLSAITDLQFDAAVVDSTGSYTLGLTITNLGQTTVHFDGPQCAVFAVIRDAPDAGMIMPIDPTADDPSGAFEGPVCIMENVLTFDLEPGESWTSAPRQIPMYDDLVPQLVDTPHWYQVGIGAGLTDAIEEPHFVDIGWRQMAWPEHWPPRSSLGAMTRGS